MQSFNQQAATRGTGIKLYMEEKVISNTKITEY